MTEENYNSKSAWKRYIIFVVALICFVGIPAFILSYSVYKFFKKENEQIFFVLNSHVQQMSNEMKKNISAEIYFCRLFHEYISSEIDNPNSTEIETISNLKKIKGVFGEGIDFVVITNDGKIGYNTTSYSHTPDEYLSAYYFASYHYSPVENHRKNGILPSVEKTRKILGPQVVVDTFRNLYSNLSYSLIWADSAKTIPPNGVYFLRWGGFFVFISEKLLREFKHIKYIAQEFAANNQTISGVYNPENINEEFWCSSDKVNIKEIKKYLSDGSYNKNASIETENYCICHQALSSKLKSFLMAPKKNTDLAIIFKFVFVFFIYCLFSFPIIKYGWNTIVLNSPGDASIRLKLGFLFLFATGIPLLTLAIIAHEYNLDRKISLTEEARLWSVENLLKVEQRYSSYLKGIVISLDNFIDEWSKKLVGKELSNEIAQELGREFRKYGSFDFYCCASESKIIGTFEGLFKYTGSVDTAKIDKKLSVYNQNIPNYRYDELKLSDIIIKKLCGDLNNTPISGYVMSKLELIAESLMQKSFPEIISSIIQTVGFIKEWGVANRKNMTYFKFISLYDKTKTDYIAMTSWHPRTIQAIFVNSIIDKANRNPQNFKFIAYERHERTFLPNKYEKYPELVRFAKRANEMPTEELELINLDGEEYIAVSFSGRGLYRYSFVGLYPMRNIDNVIYEQSSFLWLLGLLCLIFSIGLAQLLTKSFVQPLLRLQEGALAIESRNFKYRLSDLGRDEFGEVGSIFNHVMVGLEELEIAKIVQESMFPKPEFKQGRFSVYGKSITMADVGGDYLDFFKVDDNSFSLLLGDVAGHGVGAAVIMAMAKAAVLGGGEELKSPALMLNNLHRMIMATKNKKQRKIMTFQYLHVNSETAEIHYSNAGACSPWLIRHDIGVVEEMKMSSSALGAFKKAVYREMPLYMQPRDAMVFYTDGIVECKNPKGEMLGYDRLKLLLQKCWDINPETYYNNIYGAYKDYVGADAEADDDLTIVIMVYNEPEAKLPETEAAGNPA